MKSAIYFIQIIVSVGLIVSILLQAKGSGLGTAFGGSSEQYRSKRGVEKLLLRGTVILAAFFLIISVINLLIQ